MKQISIPLQRLAVFFFLLFFFLRTPSLLAEDHSTMIKSLIQHGKKVYAHGEIDKAMNDFSRVLLLDPDNKEAQEYLIGMASSSRLTVMEKFHIMFLEDLLNHINNLKRKINYFEGKKDMLIQELLEKGAAKDFLEEQLAEIEDQTFEADTTNQVLENKRLDDQGDLLNAVNNSLKIQSEQLSDRILLLQEQFSLLREMNKQGILRSSEKKLLSDQAPSVDAADPNMPEDIEAASSHESVIMKSQDDIHLFKDELAGFHKQLEELQERMEEKEKKVEDLNKEVVNLALLLSEKEMLLTEKIDRLSALNYELVDLKSRFELGQRIIQEKNSKIQLMQDTFQKIVMLEDRKMRELNGILNIYKGKLSDASKSVKHKDQDLFSLEGKLDSLETQLLEKDQALQKAQENLVAVESQLINVHKELLELKGKSPLQNPGSSDLNKEILNLESKLENIRHFLLEQLDEFERISIFPVHHSPNDL